MTLHRTFEYELNGRTLEVPVKIYLARECNYGADLDGNRGVVRTICDDIDYDLPSDLTHLEQLEIKTLVDNDVDNLLERGMW